MTWFDDFAANYVQASNKRKTYPGTERRQALKDFAAYQKSHPGIIAVKDIEKARWER